jgi:hypothetical protein
MKRNLFLKIALSVVAVALIPLFCVAERGESSEYWREAATLRKGVKVKELSFTEPRLMKAWMMRIDLRTPGIGFTTTERDGQWGEMMPDYTNKVYLIRTKRECTADFMNRRRAAGLNVEIAINTAPWGPWCPPWNHKWGDFGRWVVSDGVEVCPAKAPGKEALFVVYKDGRVEITSSVAKKDLASVAHVHPGFKIIATNLVAIVGKDNKSVHPRTAFGISQDKRYLFLLVVDGRQPGYSLGANLNDLCRMMFKAGASDVINMDGGGSTTMVVYDRKERKPRMLNRHKGGRIRKVALNLGVTFD